VASRTFPSFDAAGDDYGHRRLFAVKSKRRAQWQATRRDMFDLT
jgi:hypothetical protein